MAPRRTDMARRVVNVPATAGRRRDPGLVRRDQVPWNTKRVPGTSPCPAVCNLDSTVHAQVSSSHVPQGKPAISIDG
jgi:hypothetical protein